MPPAFSLKRRIDRDEIRFNIAKWKTRGKIFKSIDFSVAPDAMSAVKAGKLFTESKIEDKKIAHDAIVEKYLRSRKRD